MPSSKPAQDFVPIKEVRDGVVILKDGTHCMILLASSLNFALKSADEQQAIILQFQNFLNSLDFTTQILIQSRKLDIRPYIATLEDQLKEQNNELLKIQIREYIGFVRNFTESTNIMSKTFFVVIPYNAAPQVTGSSFGLGKLFGGGKKSTTEVKAEDQARFEELRSQLEQRVSVVQSGLVRTGIRVALLGTEEIVELYFKMFNPGETIHPAAQG